MVDPISTSGEPVPGLPGEGVPAAGAPGAEPVIPSGEEVPAGGVPAVGTPGESVVAPTARTYSQEEWDKRQSAVDKRISSAQREAAEGLRKAEEKHFQLLEEERRRQDTAFLTSVRDSGGDMDAANRLVTAQQTNRTREAELARQEAAFKTTQESTAQGLKLLDAQRLAKEYGVPAEPLMEATDPAGMKNLALEAALAQAREGSKAPVKTATGVPAAAKGVGWAELSPDAKIQEGLKDMTI